MTGSAQGFKGDSELLSGFNEADLTVLAEYGDIRELEPGTLLFEEGQTGDSLFFILTGEVEIQKKLGRKQGRHTIANVGEGTMLGELSLVDGLPYSATALVTQSARILSLSHQDLDRLSGDHPAISLQILNGIAKVIARRLRRTTDRLIDQYELALEVGWIAPSEES